MNDPYGPPPSDASEPNPPQYGQQPPPPPPYDQAPGQYGAQPGGQPQYGGAAYGREPGPDGLTPDERTWGGAAHWSALIGAFVAMAFLGPLLVLLAKGNTSPYIRQQAVESLNFQISVLIYAVISFVLLFLLVGFLLLPAVGIFWLVLTIMGSVKSANGELYRYPLTIRMVS